MTKLEERVALPVRTAPPRRGTRCWRTGGDRDGELLATLGTGDLDALVERERDLAVEALLASPARLQAGVCPIIESVVHAWSPRTVAVSTDRFPDGTPCSQ